MKRKKKYFKKSIFCLGVMVFLISFPAYARESRQNGIRCQGNFVLEQENDAGKKVAFYEADTKYLKSEIERLQSQIEN